MVYTHKNGDWGMVYDCSTHIHGAHPSGVKGLRESSILRSGSVNASAPHKDRSSPATWEERKKHEAIASRKLQPTTLW